MYKNVAAFLIAVVAFNSYSFFYEVSISYRIIGHGVFMPLLSIFYGNSRNWQFGLIDKLVFLCCLFGGMCDAVIFFDLNERGEFVQLVFNFIVQFILITIFRKEGAYVFNVEKSNFLKVLIPCLITFFFFGFVLMRILPIMIYFLATFYAAEITILVVLGYYRPVKNRNFWIVAFGVSIIMLRDILYSYFFYVYKGTHPLLYVPLYLSNAIGYFLIIYGVALNQNSKKTDYEKISIKAILKSFKGVFISETPKVKRRIYETLSVIGTKYV